MSIIKIRSDEFRAGIWANGAGRSWTIAVSPAGAQLPNVLLQFATAQIERSVPFSFLPGIDRVLTLLDGPGFSLSFADGREIAVDRVGDPVWFPGDVETECHVTGGSSRALNLLYARTTYRAEVKMLDGSAKLTEGADVALLYALKHAATVAVGGDAVQLAEGDAAIVDHPASPIDCTVSGDNGRLFAACLFAVAP